jgi:hypothetical protein
MHLIPSAPGISKDACPNRRLELAGETNLHCGAPNVPTVSDLHVLNFARMESIEYPGNGRTD